MRYQTRKYSCGAAAVVNALKCFGKNVSEKRIMVLAGTNKETGTGTAGIKVALEHYGRTVDIKGFATPSQALFYLSTHLEEIGPVIIDINQGQHWVTVVGRTANGYLVADSQRTKKNRRENGLHVIPADTFSIMWLDPKVGTYLAISVG